MANDHQDDSGSMGTFAAVTVDPVQVPTLPYSFHQYGQQISGRSAT
jgi:hypothetical protein